MAQVVTYLSVLLCMQMNPEWSWRAAFRYPMVPLLLTLIGFLLFFKNSPSDAGLPELEEESAEHSDMEKIVREKGALYPYKLLFSEPKVIMFCLISAIAGIGRYGLLTWLPTYFVEEHGMAAAVQAVLFGFLKDTFGWIAVFVIIGVLYIILLVLTLVAKNMKTKNI